MPVEVILPRVDMDMKEAKISRWLKREGDAVKAGETVFEIETDKAAMEIEAPASGVLRGVSAEEGAVVGVGVAVAWIYAESEPFTPTLTGHLDGRPPGLPLPAFKEEEGDLEVSRPEARVLPHTNDRIPLATPKARRLARERGVSLVSLRGTGPQARIQAEDVPLTPNTALPTLHLERRGEDAIPAVFIHGFGSELSIWKATLASLSPTLATVQLDLPAHGKSPMGGVQSFGDIVEAVAASLKHRGIASCHLVGHSLGGMIALALASSGGLDVRSLMMISPAGLGPDIEREFLEGFTRATRVESLTPWLRLLFAKPSLVTPAFARAIMQSRDDETLRAEQRRFADTMFPDGTQANDLRDALENLRMPCKIVWGRQDRIIPVTHTANLPGHVALHLLADTGHVPHLEQPKLLARLIEELVRSAG